MRQLINPRHLRWSALLLVAIAGLVLLGSSLTVPPAPRDSRVVRLCKNLVEVWLVDDFESVGAWLVDELTAGENSVVNLQFRHLDRTGHYRLKDVTCTRDQQRKLLLLSVDETPIPLDEDGTPSLSYLEGPEYSALR
jgi:hypothetical protein